MVFLDYHVPLPPDLRLPLLLFLPSFLSTSLFTPKSQLYSPLRLTTSRYPPKPRQFPIFLSPPPLPSPPKFSSTISPKPVHNCLRLGPHRPLDPSNVVGIRRASVVWFRNDLRLHDNECLNSAHNESISVLPVYCFDPSDYGKSSSGFDKTGHYRAGFLIESVSELRKSLQAKGSDLVIRVGKPETVLLELVKAIGAEAVYVHRDVSHDEVKTEERVEAAMREDNVEVKYFWGSTLFHLDHLPFKLEDMPTNYGGFREKVKGLKIRKTIEVLDQLKGLPSRGDVEPGDIPTLTDLGLNPSATVYQDGMPAANASMLGGETKALNRLRKFAAECQAQARKAWRDGTHDSSIYGANFSCKIFPWLAIGCISPRSMFNELKKAAHSRNTCSGDSETGTSWLMPEFLWRDFFRFITKKYSSEKKQLYSSAANACAGTLA